MPHRGIINSTKNFSLSSIAFVVKNLLERRHPSNAMFLEYGIKQRPLIIIKYENA